MMGDDDSWFGLDADTTQGYGSIQQLTTHAHKRVKTPEPMRFRVIKKRGMMNDLRLDRDKLHSRSVAGDGDRLAPEPEREGAPGRPHLERRTMRRFKVYLAGPITGLVFDVAQDWRDYVRETLEPVGIDAYSPLRQKHFLRSAGVLDGSYENPLATDRGIMTRDFNDCKTADVIFANLLDAKVVSTGTVMEIGWAHSLQIPLIAVMEEHGNPHEHPMVREAIRYRVTTLEHAMAITQAILLPHSGEKR